jgi:hypothetical protein
LGGGGDEQKEEHENEKVASLTAVRGDIDMYIYRQLSERGKSFSEGFVKIWFLLQNILKLLLFPGVYSTWDWLGSKNI